MSSSEQKARITSITIENFKGIGAPITIPIRPITLLFGKNSVGKSTIIEALLLMNDWMKNIGPDVDTVEQGGEVIHLGGFKRFVHKHDLGRNVRIRVDFTLGPKKLSRYPDAIIDSYIHDGEEEDENNDTSDLDVVDVHNLVDIKTCYCEVVAGQFPKGDIRFLEYNVGINGERVLSKKGRGLAPYKEMQVMTWEVNSKHPAIKALKRISPMTRKLLLYHEDTKKLALNLPLVDEWLRTVPFYQDKGEMKGEMYDYQSNVPRFYHRAVRVHACPVEIDDPVWKKHRIKSPEKTTFYDTRFLSHFISQVLLGTTMHLRMLFSGHIFIGPLRKVPPKVSSNLLKKNASWADGTSAWKTIISPIFVADDDKISAEVEESKRSIGSVSEDLHALLLESITNLSMLEWIDNGTFSKENYEASVAIINDKLMVMGFGYGVSLKTYFKVSDDSGFMKSASRLCEHPRSKKWQKALNIAMDEIQNSVEYELVFVDRITGVELRPPELGIGVSQMLPVLVGSLCSDPTIMSVQQPELHLHPSLQCDLADYFLIANQIAPKTIIIETHSEHLILRILRRIRESYRNQIPNDNSQLQIKSEELVVLYADQASDGTRIRQLRINDSGEFIDEWPEGFFEEGFNEIVGGL